MRLKHLFPVLSLVVLAAAQAVPAQADGGRFMSVRAMPIGMLLGEYLVDANFAILDSISVGAIGYYANIDINDSTAKGSGFGGRITWHFNGNKISTGWSLSAYSYYVQKIELSQTSIFNPSVVLRGSVENLMEAGVVIGKSWVWESGFMMTLAGGVRTLNGPEGWVLRSADGSATSTVTSDQFSGIQPRLEFAMGFAF